MVLEESEFDSVFEIQVTVSMKVALLLSRAR